MLAFSLLLALVRNELFMLDKTQGWKIAQEAEENLELEFLCNILIKLSCIIY